MANDYISYNFFYGITSTEKQETKTQQKKSISNHKNST